MRIAIDLTATPKAKTGIGRYMLGLLEGLQQIDSTNEYFLFVQDDDIDGFNVNASNFHMVPVHSKILRHQSIRIVWEQVIFPWRLKKNKIDVLQCPNYTMPYPVKLIYPHLKVVGTFHDMTYFILEDCHVGWKREFFKHYIKRTAKKADKIITISENSKKDIPNYCKLKNPDITVTYMGVKDAFFTAEAPDSKLLSEFGIPDTKYISYVGTLEPRKNVPGLLGAYALLPEELRNEYKLVLMGKKGWLYDEIFERCQSDAKLKGNVYFTGYVPDEKMVRIVKGASCFVYPSFYEGFGIPVIEGMAAGVPTVTSYGSSLEEVAGDCCYLSDPKSEQSICDAIIAALSADEDERRIKISGGIERARNFNWKACAENTVKAYEEAYKA